MKRAIACMIMALMASCVRTDTEAANRAVKEFQQNFPDATGSTCAATDTDGDGYCSCTIFRGKEVPLQVQCGCEKFCIWNCAVGCKYVEAVKVLGR